MQIDLAIAVACEPAACRVRPIGGGADLDARYGAKVKDRIKVRPGDLVAVDTESQPPKVLYRWWHGTVEAVNGDQVTVVRNVSQARPEDPRRASMTGQLGGPLLGQVQSGDTVFFGGEGHRILDVARQGNPAHPERLREELLPEVRLAYSGTAGA